MFFEDWQTHKEESVNPALLWEYNTKDPSWNWQKMRNITVERVVEMGLTPDYYAIYQLYGGPEKVREIVKNLPYLDPKVINFACCFFNLEKEELRCYRRQLSRRTLLLSLTR